VGVVPTAEDWYNKGVVLDKANRRFEEALQCYDKALEIDPEYVQAWYGKGDALYLMARCYDKARKIDPEYVQAWYGKGDALYLIGKCDNVLTCLEEALLCFDKVLKLEPQNVAAAGRKQQTLKAIRNLE
jgi:tetratricopeptide (TPR) repeat protein